MTLLTAFILCGLMTTTHVQGSTHHPVQDFPKNYVLPVQPQRPGGQDEELRAVGVWAGVGHAHLVCEHISHVTLSPF